MILTTEYSNNANRPSCRDVGTRGEVGWMWGPCACPGEDVIPLGFHDDPLAHLITPAANLPSPCLQPQYDEMGELH
jgi:hypothetical protein